MSVFVEVDILTSSAKKLDGLPVRRESCDFAFT